MTIIGYDNQGRPVYNTTVTPEQLEAARQAESERVNAAVAARKEAEAAHRAEQERIAREAGAAELAAYKERVRAAWLDNGGTAASFEAEWPKLSREHVRERAAEQLTRHERLVEQEKAALRASGRYSL